MQKPNPFKRALVLVPTSWAVAYFVFWACAPPSTLPPPLPMMAGARNQVGASFAMDMGLEATYDSTALQPQFLPNAQIWYQRALSERFSLQATAFGGYSSIAGAGIGLRYLHIATPRLRLGTEAQLGWAWARLGMPFAVALGPRAQWWFYTDPAVQLAMSGVVHVPLGLAYQASGWTVALETGTDLLGEASSTIFVLPAPLYYATLGISRDF